MEDWTNAEWALLISALSAAVALVSLIWSLTLFRLSGSRLSIRLTPGIHTEVGHLFRGPDRGWKGESKSFLATLPSLWMDVALITVTNIGRTPVSVWNIALDFGHEPWWKPWSRYTVQGAPICVHEGSETNNDVRLEAGQSVVVIYDLWPLVDGAMRVRKSKSIRVRGSAKPAGRRSVRSPRRHSWAISARQESLWPHGDQTNSLKVFHEIWRAVVHTEPDKVYETLIAVRSLAIGQTGQDGVPVSEISEILKPSLGDFQAMLAAQRLKPLLDYEGQKS